MSKIDDLINQQARIAVERAAYYEKIAIPHYSTELHKCLDEKIALSEEVRHLRKQVNEQETDDTEKQLLLEYLTSVNENSNFESIKESIEKGSESIDEHSDNRSKSNGQKKKRSTTN